MTGARLFFRRRPNGATAFRVTLGTRVEMEPLADLKLRSGDIRLRGDRSLTDDEQAEITAWMARAGSAQGGPADDLIEALNHVAHWAQGAATQPEIDAISDDLLLAMHDLRAVLVRRAGDG